MRYLSILTKASFAVRFLMSVVVLVCLSPFSAVAEEEAEKPAEKVEVVGSHIKRTDVEGPSPVLVISREDIEMSGYNSLSDVLRDLPVASLGSASEYSLDSPSSKNTSSIRGLSQDHILVLIDGRRMNTYGGENKADLNIIPLSIIDQVQILTTGASATYGSDAIAGVINLVTKKGAVGGQLNVQGSLVQREEGNGFSALSSFFDFWNWDDTGPSSTDNSWKGKGDKLSIDASYGGNKNDLNYLVGGQVRFNAPLYQADRAFGKLTSPADGSTFGSPGSWSADDGGTWNAADDCPEENKKSNGVCGFDYSRYMQFTPQILQTSAFAKMDMPLGDALHFDGMALYSFTRSHSVIAPPPDDFAKPKVPGDTDYRIPVETAQKWGLSASQPATVKYRLVDEEGAGPRSTVLNVHSYQTQATLTQMLGHTMELKGNLNLSGSYYSSVSKGYFNKETLFEMANEGTFNPFLPKDKKNDISKASYEPTEDVFANLVSFEPTLTGELGELAGQPFMFAVGGLSAHEYYLKESDEITKDGKQWGGGVANEGEGSRFYGALYGELSAFLFEMAELQLAARSDYYSDVGLAWQEKYLPMPLSPQVALSVQPLSALKFRASWGLGFKAPSLKNLHDDEVVEHPFARDWVVCNDDYLGADPANKDKDVCKPSTQYKTFKRGNDEVNPEFSESFNVGMILEPVERVSVSLDYYRTNQNDIVYQPPLNDIFKYEAEFGADKLRDFGIVVTRKPDGTVDNVVSVPANLAEYKVRGLDLALDASVPIDSGWDFGFRFEHSHLLYVQRQALKDGPVENPVPYYDWMVDLFGIENADSDRKGSITDDFFPRWRNRTTFSVMNQNMGHKFDLVVHNIPSRFREGTQDPDKLIDYYWQLDLRGAFRIQKNLHLIAGIKNILGFERPVKVTEQEDGADSLTPYGNDSFNYPVAGFGINSHFYSMRGRTVDLRVTYDF